MDRRRALLLLISLFTAGNALCALAPGFGLLLGARVLTALCHGSFFGIASVLAANIVPKNERAQAIALLLLLWLILTQMPEPTHLLGGWLSDRRQISVILGGMALLVLTFRLMPSVAGSATNTAVTLPLPLA